MVDYIFRKLRKNIFASAVIVFFYSIVSPSVSYAYIDPNTGGIFFTSVLPFVYGILAAVVIFWKRIVNAIKGLFSRNKDESGK